MVEGKASYGVLVALRGFSGEGEEGRFRYRKRGKFPVPKPVRSAEDRPGSDAVVFVRCEEGVAMG